MAALIAFEESQAVCMALRRQGIEAYSCDLKPASGGHPEFHLQMDAAKAIQMRKWAFIGMHPVCTKLTRTSNRTYAQGKPKHHERLEAIEETIGWWRLALSHSELVYMENPVGVLNTDLRLPKPQIIHPYYFGDPFQKETCLWLHGLPKLIHSAADTLFETKTHADRGEMVEFPSGKRMPKWYADLSSSKSESNRTLRSKTFPGIARAMAEQWGKFL